MALQNVELMHESEQQQWHKGNTKIKSGKWKEACRQYEKS